MHYTKDQFKLLSFASTSSLSSNFIFSSKYLLISIWLNYHSMMLLVIYLLQDRLINPFVLLKALANKQHLSIDVQISDYRFLTFILWFYYFVFTETSFASTIFQPLNHQLYSLIVSFVPLVNEFDLLNCYRGQLKMLSQRSNYQFLLVYFLIKANTSV